MRLKSIDRDWVCKYLDADYTATFDITHEEALWLSRNPYIDPYIDHKTAEMPKINSRSKKMSNNKIKVIFNNPVTVLYYKGKKYVSKAHDETFDEEKGLLMCLAKANGISHLELKRILKNAQRQKNKK